MPFPIKAIQVDGGSEFESIFEQECQQRGTGLSVPPPRSPKLNGGFEQAHRTHTEEFYEVTDSSLEPDERKSRTIKMGDNIQHLSPPPGIRLYDSPSISGPKKKGGRVTNHMNEHKSWL
jgi:hypothetical protein